MFNKYGLIVFVLLFPVITQASELTGTSAIDSTSYTSNVTTSLALPNATILGSSTVTNTGLTVVQGNVAVSPGTAITGFPPGVIVGGALHGGDALAAQAHATAQAYYNALIAQNCPAGHNLSGQDLGGKTLAPGVYCFDSSAQLTGVLILNGKKKSSYTFQIGSTLTTASASKVVLTGGVKDVNVNWAIGSSATLGTGTVFQGIIDAVASITMTTNVSLKGRAWALNGAVTLDTNAVNI
jgi:type VI secretion system secreted protein VgrG